ncbi:protein roadkill-like [Planococcus citri]|uniref:protein roadkill-like n=1 Tax=Planococcus citri TaxID=170843 RepID=UPI0031F9B8FE
MADNPVPVQENNVVHNENWCCTKIRKVICGYTWTIQDYKSACSVKGTILKSPVFSATAGSCKWYIKVYPRTEDGDMELYLEAINSDEVEKYGVVCGDLKFSLINSEGQEANVKKTDFMLDEDDTNAGFAEFISNEYLFSDANRLLPQGKLTIHCEVITICQDDLVHVSGLCDQKTLFEIHECNPLKEFGKLMNNADFSDITICVDGKEFPAHKSILAGRSRVFAAMLQHEMKENQLNRIVIEDIDENTFLEALRFIYTGKVQNIETIAFKLLPVADRYDLQELKLMCEKVLSSKLCKDTVVKTLIFSDTHDVKNLKAWTIEYIKVNSIDILNSMGSEGWDELVSRPNLMKDVLTEYMKK